MNGLGILAGVVAVFAALIGLTVIFGSWYTIDEGERGVTLRNGAIAGIATPGLHFKAPIIDDVIKISVQDHVEIYDMEAYSRDQQPAKMRASVSYRLLADEVESIYRIYGSQQGVLDRLITRKVLEETKTVFGRFNAETSIRERGRLNVEIREAIQQGVEGPVIILGVQVEDIEFSAAYEQSVEERMLAEVQVQREQQNLEREKVLADIVRTQALADADKVREAARAEADAIRLRGDAEAQAIDARGKALRDSPALIQLVQAEKWNGELPTTMPPAGTVPFLSLPTQ